MSTRTDMKFVDPQSSTIPDSDYDSMEWDPPYTTQNLCVICGFDMGDCNPRQFCGKTHCLSPPMDKINSGEVDSEGYYIGLPLENYCRVCGEYWPECAETGRLCLHCFYTLEKLKRKKLTVPNKFKLYLIEELITQCAECGCKMDGSLGKLCGGTKCLDKTE